MHTLLLVRHGETAWNAAGRFQGHTDVPLNDEGRAQAHALAARLRDFSVCAIASSDLLRAHDTAVIIASGLGLGLASVDADLRERGYGCFEGLTRDECEARHADAWARLSREPDAELPGFEPRHLVGTRMLRAITRLLGDHGRTDGASIVVSHGGAIRAFLELATGDRVPPVPNVGVYQVPWEGREFGEPRLL